jgi:hypothetical protein
VQIGSKVVPLFPQMNENKARFFSGFFFLAKKLKAFCFHKILIERKKRGEVRGFV